MVLINICKLLQNEKFESSIFQTKKISKRKIFGQEFNYNTKVLKVLKIKGCTRVVVGCSYNLFDF